MNISLSVNGSSKFQDSKICPIGFSKAGKRENIRHLYKYLRLLFQRLLLGKKKIIMKSWVYIELQTLFLIYK